MTQDGRSFLPSPTFSTNGGSVAPRPTKRSKRQPHPTPHQISRRTPTPTDCCDDMDIVAAEDDAHLDRTVDTATGEEKEAQAEVAQKRANPDDSGDSDSSDWGDWADAMVERGDDSDGDERSSGAAAAAAAAAAAGGASSSGAEEDEEAAWAKSMMDQGTDRSVVEEYSANSRAWDYVLQLAVEEDRSVHQTSGGAVTTPVQAVVGVAAMEYVGRWLGGSLPHSFPALQTLRRLNYSVTAQQIGRGTGGAGGEMGLVRDAVVDSVARPSAVALVSCAAEQTTPRMLLFSLSANSGAALAAEVVQPEAAGLLTHLHSCETSKGTRGHGQVRSGSWPGETVAGESTDGFRPEADGARGRRSRGVVFECLDSRIMEQALTAAMGRLGLGVECRSRSGMWRLPPGGKLTNVPDLTILNGVVEPLRASDAGDIACATRPPGSGDCDAATNLILGLVRRNGGVGIRRGGHLVSWCLGFDNGLAGALHATSPPSQRREETSATTNREDATAIILHFLLTPISGHTQTPVQQRKAGNAQSTGALAAAVAAGMGREELRLSAGQSSSSSSSSSSNSSNNSNIVRALILDDNSPFVGLFRDLGLERVCDADWVRFVPASRVMLASGEETSGGRGVAVGGGGQELPFAALATHP